MPVCEISSTISYTRNIISASVACETQSLMIVVISVGPLRSSDRNPLRKLSLSRHFQMASDLVLVLVFLHGRVRKANYEQIHLNCVKHRAVVRTLAEPTCRCETLI